MNEELDIVEDRADKWVNLPTHVKNLSAKQRKFAEYYAATGRVGESCRRAGYSESYAIHHSGKMTKDAEVQDAVAYFRAIFDEAAGTSPEKIIMQLAEIANIDVSNFVDEDWQLRKKSEMTKEQLRSMTGLEIGIGMSGRGAKPKFARIEALKELGKIYGIYKENEQGKAGLDLHITLGQQVTVGDEAVTTQVGHIRIVHSGEEA